MANVTDEKWVKRFIDLADTISTWSKDTTKVGAVLVTESCKIVGQGYNGLLPGMDDSLLLINDREFKIMNTIHAEINALVNLSKGYSTTEDLYMFVSKPMCSNCAKHIALHGITAVYCKSADNDFNTRWNNTGAKTILKHMGIEYNEI